MKLFYKVLAIGFPVCLLYSFSNKLLYSEATGSVNDRLVQHKLARTNDIEGDGVDVDGTSDLKPSADSQEDPAEAMGPTAIRFDVDTRPKEKENTKSNENQSDIWNIVKPKVNNKLLLLLPQAELLSEDNKKKELYEVLNEALKKKPAVTVDNDPFIPDQESNEAKAPENKESVSEPQNKKLTPSESQAESKTPNVPATSQNEDKGKTNQGNENADISNPPSQISVNDSKPESNKQDANEPKCVVINNTVSDINANQSNIAGRKKREIYEKQMESNGSFPGLPDLPSLPSKSEERNPTETSGTAIEQVSHNGPSRHSAKDRVKNLSSSQLNNVDNEKHNLPSQRRHTNNRSKSRFPEVSKLPPISVEGNVLERTLDKTVVTNDPVTNRDLPQIPPSDRVHRINQYNDPYANSHEFPGEETGTRNGSNPRLPDLTKLPPTPEEQNSQTSNRPNIRLADRTKLPSTIRELNNSAGDVDGKGVETDPPQRADNGNIDRLFRRIFNKFYGNVRQKTQTRNNSNSGSPDLSKSPSPFAELSSKTSNSSNPTFSDLPKVPSTLQELNKSGGNLSVKRNESEPVTVNDPNQRLDNGSVSLRRFNYFYGNSHQLPRQETQTRNSSNPGLTDIPKLYLTPVEINRVSNNRSAPGLPVLSNLPSAREEPKMSVVNGLVLEQQAGKASRPTFGAQKESSNKRQERRKADGVSFRQLSHETSQQMKGRIQHYSLK